MKKLLFSLILMSFSFTNQSFAQNWDYLILVSSQTKVNTPVTLVRPDTMTNTRRDSFFIALLTFIVTEFDNSIRGEIFSVYTSNAHEVAILKGKTHTVFIKIGSKHEPVVLIEKTFGSQKKYTGGELQITEKGWSLNPEGKIIVSNNNPSPGTTVVDVGRFGRFEIPQDNDSLWKTDYDNGL